jgi:hypothetical protein
MKAMVGSLTHGLSCKSHVFSAMGVLLSKCSLKIK